MKDPSPLEVISKENGVVYRNSTPEHCDLLVSIKLDEIAKMKLTCSVWTRGTTIYTHVVNHSGATVMPFFLREAQANTLERIVLAHGNVLLGLKEGLK